MKSVRQHRTPRLPAARGRGVTDPLGLWDRGSGLHTPLFRPPDPSCGRPARRAQEKARSQWEKAHSRSGGGF